MTYLVSIASNLFIMQERHFLAMLTRLEAEMLNIDLVTLFIKNLNLFSVISVELFIADCSTLHMISSMRSEKKSFR